jgi:four helix bundle protein
MDQESKPQDIKERTFVFAAEIVRFCDALDSRRGTVRTLGRQLLRAGTSIGANVEEAQAGQSRADFISKYSIALKEARESIYWLRLLKTTGICSAQPDKLEDLRHEAEQIARIIGSIVVNTKKGR